MAGNITNMSLSISGLDTTEVDNLVTLFTDYLVLPNPRISGSVSLPSQSLQNFDPEVFTVTFSRVDPTSQWATKETDLMAGVVTSVAPSTP